MIILLIASNANFTAVPYGIGDIVVREKIYLRVQRAHLAQILYRIVILRAKEINNDRSHMLFEGWSFLKSDIMVLELQGID